MDFESFLSGWFTTPLALADRCQACIRAICFIQFLGGLQLTAQAYCIQDAWLGSGLSEQQQICALSWTEMPPHEVVTLEYRHFGSGFLILSSFMK
jgi:hypothetical protein